MYVGQSQSTSGLVLSNTEYSVELDKKGEVYEQSRAKTLALVLGINVSSLRVTGVSETRTKTGMIVEIDFAA